MVIGATAGGGPAAIRRLATGNGRAVPALPQFNADVIAKQQDFVRPMHAQFLAKTATCIDCHKGIAPTTPDE